MEHEGSLRAVEVEEVEKMLKCEDGAYGFSTYKCNDCQKVFTVPFTCKSRLWALLLIPCGNIHYLANSPTE